MISIEDIRGKLLKMEHNLAQQPDIVWAELCTVIEPIMRHVITECLEMTKSRDDIKRIRDCETDLGRGDLTYHNFGFGKLINLWKRAKIADIWSRIQGYQNPPAVMSSFPFAEFNELRNPKVHHSVAPGKTVVLRLFYTTTDLFNQIYPIAANTNVESYRQAHGDTGPLQNLPRKAEHEFVGRTEESHKLMTRLSRNFRGHIVSITGIGGVGKSALAVEVAYRCLFGQDIPDDISAEDVRFDAVVWTSAKQKSLLGDGIKERMTVNSRLDDIVREIIRVLSPENSGNQPEKQLETARQLLSEKRVLLIVDNMETIEDELVISFLQELPEPSKAIITDRRSVQFSYAIQLCALPFEESLKLARECCSQRNIEISDSDVEEIARITGGIPLAVIWAVGQMSNPCMGPENVRRRLQQVGRDSVLDFLFTDSFNNITENSRRLLRMLSLPGTPMPGELLAQLLGLSQDETTDALVELLRFALLNETADEKAEAHGTKKAIIERTYQVHPLTRIFIMDIESSKNEMEKLLTDELLQLLSSREVNPDWPSVETIDFVDRHHEMLTWAIEKLFEREEYNKVIRFGRYISYALGIRGYHDLRLDIAALAFEAAEKTGKPREQARALIHNIGWIYFTWYRFKESTDALEQGLELLKTEPDPLLAASAQRTLGQIAKEKGNLDKAKELIMRARDEFEKIDARYFLAITYGTLGSLMRDYKQYDKAEQYLLKAIDIASGLPNTEEILSIFYQKMSKLMMVCNRLDEADAWNRKALKILNILRRQVGRAHCLLNLALISEKKANFHQALAYVNEAAELFAYFGAKKDIDLDLKRIKKKAAELKLVSASPEV